MKTDEKEIFSYDYVQVVWSPSLSLLSYFILYLHMVGSPHILKMDALRDIMRNINYFIPQVRYETIYRIYTRDE